MGIMALKRNRGGRPTWFPGAKVKGATFMVSPDVRRTIRRLARKVGCSDSNFVEAMARYFAAQTAERLQALQMVRAEAHRGVDRDAAALVEAALAEPLAGLKILHQALDQAGLKVG
jgi:hypothetical protein